MIYFADFRHSSPTLEFPTWMHQTCVGYADLTDLECMASIPARASRGSDQEEAGEALVKSESILANLQQRFKKDQIYVSV